MSNKISNNKISNKREIITGEIYHVFNRGVDKRDIFIEDQDYFRGIHDLFEFNDTGSINNLTRELLTRELTENQSSPPKRQLVDLRSPPDRLKERKPRKLVVEILAFSLLPNHFHLLLKQKASEGITKFMRKLGIGYAKYFNRKYKRSGALFEGRYKIVPVRREEHLLHLPYYIHFNVLDPIMPEWREGEIRDYQKAIKFLESCRWSSHLDYIGKKNFPSLTQRDFLLKIFGGSQAYEKGVRAWLKEMSLEKIKEMEGLLLE
jgi:putative transposase